MVRAFGSGFDGGFGFDGRGQIVIMTSGNATYEDGDILVAKNRRSIRQVHAHEICWPRNNGRKVGGMLGDSQPLLEIMLRETQQYRWERVSSTEVKRTNLWTGSEIVYGTSPVQDPDKPHKMIHCHVEDYIRYRYVHNKIPFFGSEGAERWYVGGGLKNYSHAKLDVIWQEIESRTEKREKDYVHFPFTARELTRFLVISVDDFSDVEEGELVLPNTDEIDHPDIPGETITVVVKKRKNKVNWRALRDVVEADVLDFAKPVDIRGIRKHVRASIVEAKQ